MQLEFNCQVFETGDTVCFVQHICCIASSLTRFYPVVHPYYNDFILTMTARKRQQGHVRKLMRHLKRETGTTNPHALVLRCNQLRASIERMDEQVNKTSDMVKRSKASATPTPTPTPKPTSRLASEDTAASPCESAEEHALSPEKEDAVAVSRVDDTLVKQFNRMCEMREKYAEMLHLNQEIYRKLVGAPMIEQPEQHQESSGDGTSGLGDVKKDGVVKVLQSEHPGQVQAE
jgi:hypothetical protein